MTAHSTQALLKLPRLPETWLIGIVRLRIWITPEDETPYRPWLVVVVSGETGKLRATNLFPAEPTVQEVYDVLAQGMRKPAAKAGKPARPARVVVASGADMPELLAFLGAQELEFEVYRDEIPPELDEMIADLEENLRGGPEHKGYLSVEGVTPELVGGLFRAAAEFYRAAPWIRLDNYQTIALRPAGESDYRYALVMGQGGVEYGVLMYLRWADVERQFLDADNPTEQIPDDGLHSLWYDTIDRMPFDDLEAIEKYGWEIAAPDAYPISICVYRDGTTRRLSRKDLMWYEAALLAIPELVKNHLKPLKVRNILAANHFAPVETTIDVMTHAGRVSVAVKYPGGEIALAEQSAAPVYWIDSDADFDEAPLPDRRAMEGMMAQIAGPLGDSVESGNADLDAAQDLMYQAWGETNPARRIALAHDALALSADCADAYVMLAEEEADTLSRALEYYEKGMAAGERALGKKFFDEYRGHFWGLLETRPYMRAREGVARILWQLNRKDDALGHYREMLALNPGDNQGVRYLMLHLLLDMDRYKEIEELLKTYPDDWSSEWMYTRALLSFRQYGADARAAKALAKATEQNPHVIPYLTGKKRIPSRKPDFIGMGDEREAISYAGEHLNYWRRTPGAVEWLLSAAPEKSLKNKSKQRRPRQAKK